MKSIKIKGVSKSFKQAGTIVRALKETDFESNSGSFIAIIGPSGSGKSTFLTILGGLQNPDKGTVEIGNNEFSNLNEKERAKIRFNDIGFILQSSNLIPFLKVKDQLKLYNKVKRKVYNQEKANKILNTLGILKLKDKYPKELSGGEKQRVAIARAIYHSPKLVLADEPTASLDTKKATEVVILLSKLTKELNTTIIMVTHDERMIEYCDSVYIMEDGSLSKKKGHKKTK